MNQKVTPAYEKAWWELVRELGGLDKVPSENVSASLGTDKGKERAVAAILLLKGFQVNVHGEIVIRCPYCGKVLVRKEMSVDHITAKVVIQQQSGTDSHNGQDRYRNLRLICRKCNEDKGRSSTAFACSNLGGKLVHV